MKKDLRHVRRQYIHKGIENKDLPEDPLQLFDQWFTIQQQLNNFDPNAMALSTVGLNGFPESRIVLLKEYGKEGFVFFTNYSSQKGVAIAMDPKVALLFFWPEHSRQIRITGEAKKISAHESDHYFKQRPFESQVSALVSNQSSKVNSREELYSQYEEVLKSHTPQSLQRPKNWGGYLVEANMFEFWQGRENRLHDRVVYKFKSNKWQISRIAP